ncbi:MAG TPA: acyl-CoA dehydrogenase family protein, partial [Rhizomicrobium sp.]|nr:acyl-CoA dehydrogenase family protein [Rhizomicrobium sp.]
MPIPHLIARCEEALLSAEGLVAAAKTSVREIAQGDKADGHQRAVHALAWLATYVEALRQMARWARNLQSAGRFGEIEQNILQAAFGEYLAQIAGGIPMSQSEIARPFDMGLTNADVGGFWTDTVNELAVAGTAASLRAEIADYLRSHPGAIAYGDPGLDDTMGMVREQFFRFAQEKVTPFAHQWHLKDELIPLSVIEEMNALGVFGLTVPEAHGGSGMSKIAMCVVSEELSRGYIGVGSLGTRSEIAAELILGGGTKEQRDFWLPKIASGEILPTAVFTEPNTGSDLGALNTRAVREGDTYKVSGNKTWITHAARADMMTLLV